MNASGTCTTARQRVTEAGAAVRALMPYVAEVQRWKLESMLYELADIDAKLADVQIDLPLFARRLNERTES